MPLISPSDSRIWIQSPITKWTLIDEQNIKKETHQRSFKKCALQFCIKIYQLDKLIDSFFYIN